MSLMLEPYIHTANSFKLDSSGETEYMMIILVKKNFCFSVKHTICIMLQDGDLSFQNQTVLVESSINFFFLQNNL